jgi:hypothetical protein
MFGIWIPKLKIIESEIATPKVRMKGRYQLRAVKRDGVTIARQSPWFDNLITNNGLDYIGGLNTYLTRVYVGTGTTAPAVTDSAIETEVASTITSELSNNVQNGSSPYELTRNVVRRFAQGDAEGNLTEVAIGPTAGNVFSRSLILDGGGSPTTFPVGSDEFLDVAYQLITYPPLTDATGTITITGSGMHEFIVRPIEVAVWGGSTGDLAAVFGDGLSSRNGVFADDLVALMTAPQTGLISSGFTGYTNDTYVAGSYERTATCAWPLGAGNGDIRTHTFAVTTGGFRPTTYWGCQYDPVITKTSSQLLSTGFRFSWARA